MSVLLGCIADDFTGATDLASFLVQSGMRTVQLIGVPTEPLDVSEADAVVIALKSRTLPQEEAIQQSIDALAWLEQQECQQYYFKYCSTFDSTEKGNIGPVTDALLDKLGEDFTILCPSLPVNGRSVYNGYLFVNGVLLNESGMQNHPLTPMTDANLVRVMESQSNSSVGLVSSDVISQGVDAVKAAYQENAKQHRYVVTDTISNDDLYVIGAASSELKLITGGSGLAVGLAKNFEKKGLLTIRKDSAKLSHVDGPIVVLSGSCSVMTQKQVKQFQKSFNSKKISPLALGDGSESLADFIKWYDLHKDSGPLMIYATDTPENIKHAQTELGVDHASKLVENLMSELVLELEQRGVNKFIVAGGETSGAVVKALNPSMLKIGDSIAPGVPMTEVTGSNPKLLVLKSGNFGNEFFFDLAVERML